MLSPSKRVVRLGSEYQDWFSSGDNWLGGRAVMGEKQSAVRILFPPAGTIVYLDADLPDQGARLSLRATGPEQIEWRSDSLKLERTGNREVALLTEGRHQLSVRDPLSGAEADTWLEVRAR
jgi:penicillin-binding protein 1C